MGGIVSNPLDDAKRQEIQDTVEEVMGVFSKEFAMGYKTALIDKIRAEKEEKHAKGGYEYQLVDPELVPDALSDLINIPRVAITVIDGVRDDALKALVTPALVNELAKIDAAA